MAVHNVDIKTQVGPRKKVVGKDEVTAQSAGPDQLDIVASTHMKQSAGPQQTAIADHKIRDVSTPVAVRQTVRSGFYPRPMYDWLVIGQTVKGYTSRNADHFWLLNDTSGTDDKHRATLINNGGTSVAGKFDKAMRFAVGTTQQMTTHGRKTLFLDHPLTIQGWVRIDGAVAANTDILGFTGGLKLYHNGTTDRFILTMPRTTGNVDLTNATVVVDGTWYYFSIKLTFPSASVKTHRFDFRIGTTTTGTDSSAGVIENGGTFHLGYIDGALGNSVELERVGVWPYGWGTAENDHIYNSDNGRVPNIEETQQINIGLNTPGSTVTRTIVVTKAVTSSLGVGTAGLGLIPDVATIGGTRYNPELVYGPQEVA